MAVVRVKLQGADSRHASEAIPESLISEMTKLRGPWVSPGAMQDSGAGGEQWRQLSLSGASYRASGFDRWRRVEDSHLDITF